jgi:hypothetical protein
VDQGIIAAVKAYYLQLVMRFIASGLDSDDDANIKQLWKYYNIKMAIDNIGLASEKVTERCMNACWKNLWPKMVRDFTGFKKVIDEIQYKSVQLSNQAGFDEVDKDDVEDILASHGNELANELIQLLEGRPKELDEDQDEISEVKVFDTKHWLHYSKWRMKCVTFRSIVTLTWEKLYFQTGNGCHSVLLP